MTPSVFNLYSDEKFSNVRSIPLTYRYKGLHGYTNFVPFNDTL